MANLTTKELAAVEDQLGIEQITIAKYKMYADSTTDVVLKTKYTQMASKHQQHFDKLMGCLN